MRLSSGRLPGARIAGTRPLRSGQARGTRVGWSTHKLLVSLALLLESTKKSEVAHQGERYPGWAAGRSAIGCSALRFRGSGLTSPTF
jgi:hypothetical protein